MMTIQKEPLTFTVPLGFKAHQVAEKFYQQQSKPEKAKQVYLNTLAVYAVKFYLDCLGVETDLEASDSWNPVMQTLEDIGDLEIKNRGKLECRPVLPNAKVCNVPPEVWNHRIGYIAVQLDSDLTQATLLGFVTQVTSEELPINNLAELDMLIERVSKTEATSYLAIEQPTVRLSRWLEDTFDNGWQAIEDIFDLPKSELALGYRSPLLMKYRYQAQSTHMVERGKKLGLEKSGEQVALVVGLMPTENPEMDISVQVYPTGGQTYLPKDLQLMVLDEAGEAVMQAQARSTKNIQLEFSGEHGEKFCVKVALGDISITEPFLI